MRILITGIAGFIGSNLAERLIKEGHEVVGLDNLSSGIKEQIPKNVHFHNVDVRMKHIYNYYEDIDYVFHFAAKNCISDCQKDPQSTFDNNIYGTTNVLEFSKKKGVKKVIYAESSAVYEGSTIYPTPETELKPESFYAISKATTKFIANSYYKLYNLNSTALRYFCVYGPRQDYRRAIPPVFSSFIIKLLKGEQPIIYGTGEQRRDFIYIDDINDFHIQCMKDDRTDNKVFNLGSGVNYSINEIYDIIAKLLNSNIKPIYKDNLVGEAFQNLAEITEAKKLGWTPKTSLEDGLKNSIDFIKDEIKRKRI